MADHGSRGLKIIRLIRDLVCTLDLGIIKTYIKTPKWFTLMPPPPLIHVIIEDTLHIITDL